MAKVKFLQILQLSYFCRQGGELRTVKVKYYQILQLPNFCG